VFVVNSQRPPFIKSFIALSVVCKVCVNASVSDCVRVRKFAARRLGAIQNSMGVRACVGCEDEEVFCVPDG
jgi:hypothetical protein